MARKRAGRQGPSRTSLWRFRRSPLRRRSDLVEAWLLLVAWVVGVLGGAVAGVLAAMVAEQDFEEERSGRRQVVAVLLDNARAAVPGHADVSRASATVRWTTPDGRARTGRTTVAAHTRAGTRVPVWTSARGDLVSQPPAESDAVMRSALVGVGAVIATGCVVWASARAARALLDRGRMRQWALDWERADTRRGGRTA
ncbi:Rv1733c family protein [Streptomyces puniciscabiei]|uniref:Rv1733c family protein n=1 Tax=Streptomyces puniciscabiei TaxID=164348 RepID=UPI003EB96EE1